MTSCRFSEASGEDAFVCGGLAAMDGLGCSGALAPTVTSAEGWSAWSHSRTSGLLCHVKTEGRHNGGELPGRYPSDTES